MAYIYKITNIINGKIYIGATRRTPEKRWREHINDSKRDITLNRPFHTAIREYGEDNFKIEIIEEVNSSIIDAREQFWIERLNTFEYGYNANFGGKGNRFVDYDLAIQIYHEVKSIKLASSILDVDESYLSKILKGNGVNVISSIEQHKVYKKPTLMTDKDGNQMIFESISDAGKYILNEGLAHGVISSVKLHISQCANGDRKSAYGHTWKFMTTN